MAEEKDVIEQIEETKTHLSENLAELGQQVRQTIRRFNPAYQIEQHPLAALGGSVLAGVAVGALAGSRRAPAEPSYSADSPSTGGATESRPSPFAEEFKSLKSAAWGALVATAVQVAKEKFPQYAGVVENFTENLEKKKSSSSPPLRVV